MSFNPNGAVLVKRPCWLSGLIIVLSIRGSVGQAFFEQDLDQPATPNIEEQNISEKDDEKADQPVSPLSEPLLGSGSPMSWPDPEFGLSVLLGQSHYASQGFVAFPFNHYFRAQVGWMLDSHPDVRNENRLIHGPLAQAHLGFYNVSRLTPSLSVGPGYFFSRGTEIGNTGEDWDTVGLVSTVALDLFLTENFSLLMQQFYVFLESSSELSGVGGSGSLSRSQVMFQFLF